VMDGEQRFEAPNEPVRTHQKAALQLVSDGGSIDESLETLLGVTQMRWIERVPHISQCEERWCAFKASRVPKTTPGPVFGSRHHPRGNGIQHDIPQHPQGTRSAFDNLRLVSSLKHVADPTMASVEPAAVRTVDVLHEPREGMPCRPQQQVHMVPH